MSAKPSFAELEAQRAGAVRAADREQAELEARHARERAAMARSCNAKRYEAEAAYTAALHANEKAVMSAATLAIARAWQAFEADPTLQTALPVAREYRRFEAESVEMVGRGFNPLWGNPLAIVAMQRQCSKTPDAKGVFANPNNWPSAFAGVGLVEPLSRAITAVNDRDPGRALLVALEDLQERVRKMAAQSSGRLADDQVEAYWNVMRSGAAPAAMADMFAELAKAAEQRHTAASIEEQAIIAKARAGETIPGRSGAWHRMVCATKQKFVGSVAAGLNLGGGQGGIAAGLSH